MCHSLSIHSNPAGQAEQDAALLARLVHASPAVLYSCKVAEDCGTIAVTENVRAVLGYPSQDFISDPSFWAVRIHPEDSVRVFEEMPRLFRQGEQIVEYRFRHANGRYVWIRDQMKIECDADGRPARILGSWLDITPYRRADTFVATLVTDAAETNTETIEGGYYANQI
ncbi:MAG TPA: PAS domain-containing protein [Candidatus Limnocylindria bacterium]|nr:PAS domain-containing protein [Candidatus Limnocylindria bacterium]